jgi:fructose-specific phosphotransferase system IIA component
MALVDCITTEVVKVPLTSESKIGAIEELVDILVDAGKISDRDGVIDAVLQRESKGSTGLERGIAVPHAKTVAVKELTISIGISPRGIDFEAFDGKLSHVFFLILAAPDQSGPHIEALSEIAKISKSQAFINALVNAGSPTEVVDLFRDE